MMRRLKPLQDWLSQLESSVELWSVLYLGVLIYAATVVVLTLWFVLAPYLVVSSNRILFGVGVLAYNFGYLLNNCHQLPERSLFLNGIQIPICARCIGVYVGCAAGALLALAVRIRNRLINSIFFAGLLMAPLVLDGVSQTIFTMRESTNGLRFATGALFGFGMMYYATYKVLYYSSRLELDVKRIIRTSKIVSILFTLALIALSAIAGQAYLTREDALGAVKIAHPGFEASSSTYIPPNALNTITADPFLATYNDTVLNDLTALRNVGRGGYWLFTEGRTGSSGKTAYYSTQNAARCYVDVRTGGIYAPGQLDVAVGNSVSVF